MLCYLPRLLKKENLLKVAPGPSPSASNIVTYRYVGQSPIDTLDIFVTAAIEYMVGDDIDKFTRTTDLWGQSLKVLAWKETS
jgi:hypothetical protein